VRSYRDSDGRSNDACQPHGPTVWLLSLLLVSITANAQYRFDAWNADKGLPHNVIRGLHQTPDGYLWIATLDGVSRFDGAHFTNFKKSNTSGIVSTQFNSMVGGEDGDLWLITEDGRVTRYHNKSFHTYGGEQGLPENNPVRGITSDDSGNVWILSTNKIAKWNVKENRFSEVVEAARVQYFKPLRWGHLGFWGADEKGLHCFVKGHFVVVPLPTWLSAESVSEVAIDQKKTVWVETLNGQHIHLIDGKAAIEPAASTVDFVDRQGRKWTMRVGHQLDRSMEGSTSGASPPGVFTQIIEDRESSIWLGTEGFGLYRLQPQFIQVYSKEQGLVDSNVYPIYQDKSGAVWIGAWSTGLSRFQADKFTNYTVADGLPGQFVTALYQDRDGRVWIATNKGLCIFANGTLQKARGPVLSDGTVVQAIQQDKEGSLWFGTRAGLFKYSGGNTQQLTTHDGLATNDVRVIVNSGSGDLWIGGDGGLTAIHQGHALRSPELNQLKGYSVRALYQDSTDALWIGTYDSGLIRLKDHELTRYGLRDGLYSSGVFQILEDGHDNLWMSSNHGIYRVAKGDLNEFAIGKRKDIASVGYGKIDGMLNVECNSGSWPAGTKTNDGRMWFPTQNGVAVFDPNVLPHNLQAPPVVIESSMLDHHETPIEDSIRLEPGKENLEIQYTALSFIKSNQIQFKYKMEGLDADWIDAGLRRTAYYSHMPPGKYVFRVIAGNSDGVWNTLGQNLPVIVLAPFYKTWAFLAFLALLGAALIWMIANYRIRRLQLAQVAQHAFSQQLIASQEGERKRIAAELHDSLGQRLIVIKNLALLSLRAHRQSSPDDEQAKTIEEISAEAALAIEETRTISYNLRPFQLDRLGLTKSIEGLIRTVSKSSGIRFTSDIVDIDEVFPEDMRINLYRIVQEALSNIMRHAQATEVNVRIARTSTHVRLSVQDNGRGFTPTVRPAAARHGGFGMTGMEERANLLGGGLKMRSDPTNGTLLTVEFPIKGEGHAGRS
jgi:signal transduction histidine kinase/ligand-binding sensor domain-containing protein